MAGVSLLKRCLFVCLVVSCFAQSVPNQAVDQYSNNDTATSQQTTRPGGKPPSGQHGMMQRIFGEVMGGMAESFGRLFGGSSGNTTSVSQGFGSIFGGMNKMRGEDLQQNRSSIQTGRDTANAIVIRNGTGGAESVGRGPFFRRMEAVLRSLPQPPGGQRTAPQAQRRAPVVGGGPTAGLQGPSGVLNMPTSTGVGPQNGVQYLSPLRDPLYGMNAPQYGGMHQMQQYAGRQMNTVDHVYGSPGRAQYSGRMFPGRMFRQPAGMPFQYGNIPRQYINFAHVPNNYMIGPRHAGVNVRPSLVYNRQARMGALPLGMSAPPAGSGAPPVGMGAPPLGMSALHQGIGAPSAGLGAPPAGMGAPPAGFGAPSAGMGAPPAGFGAPSAGMGAPPLGLGVGAIQQGMIRPPTGNGGPLGIGNATDAAREMPPRGGPRGGMGGPPAGLGNLFTGMRGSAAGPVGQITQGIQGMISGLVGNAVFRNLRRLGRPVSPPKPLKPKPLFCREYECPTYSVLEKTANYELRRYPSMTFAASEFSHATYPKIRTYWNLAEYILQGNNEEDLKMPLTVPILTKNETNSRPTMYFILPYLRQTSPPVPRSRFVKIVKLPAMEVYVRSTPGYLSDAQFRENAEMLKSSIGPNRTHVRDVMYSALYDTMFVFRQRYNEVWLVSRYLGKEKVLIPFKSVPAQNATQPLGPLTTTNMTSYQEAPKEVIYDQPPSAEVRPVNQPVNQSADQSIPPPNQVAPPQNIPGGINLQAPAQGRPEVIDLQAFAQRMPGGINWQALALSRPDINWLALAQGRPEGNDLQKLTQILPIDTNWQALAQNLPRGSNLQRLGESLPGGMNLQAPAHSQPAPSLPESTTNEQVTTQQTTSTSRTSPTTSIPTTTTTTTGPPQKPSVEKTTILVNPSTKTVNIPVNPMSGRNIRPNEIKLPAVPNRNTEPAVDVPNGKNNIQFLDRHPPNWGRPNEQTINQPPAKLGFKVRPGFNIF